MPSTSASEMPPGSSPDAAATLSMGHRIGKYLITEKLGEGGMGVVFGGVHEGLGRQVAIKLLRGEFLRDETVVARFQKEAEAVSRIGHGNIVAIYDFGRLEDGSLYYVMERIRGETLRQRLDRPPLPSPEETYHIFSHIGRALQAAHALGIVHRDLKPENVLLESRPQELPLIKVLDFGVAKMRETEGLLPSTAAPQPTEIAAHLTQAGSLLGTPMYMAPEQIGSGHGIDGRTDLYALGAMLYEVLTGAPPFGAGGNVMAILSGHLAQDAMPPSERARFTCPPALDQFVLRALAKNPAERFADASTFIEALREAWALPKMRTATLPVLALPSFTDAASPSPQKRWTPWLVGGLLLLGGAGALTWRLTRSARPERAEGTGASPMGAQAASTERAARTPAAAGPRDPLGAAAQAVLDKMLADGAPERRMALEALGAVGDRSALEAVAAALEAENPEVRRAAVTAALELARPEDEELRDALIEAGQGSGGAMAIDIAAARLRAGDASAAEFLGQALTARDPAVRLRAATALAGQGKVQAPPLRRALAEAPASVPRSLRWEAYVRLYQLADPAFRSELDKALAGSDPVARLDAAQTLARAREPRGLQALAQLAQAAPDLVDRVDAAAVQAELGDSGAAQALAAALTNSQPEVRARAATSLGRLAQDLPDRPATAARLALLLQDGDPQVRAAAAAALTSLTARRLAERAP